jgi:hypothetical protein
MLWRSEEAHLDDRGFSMGIHSSGAQLGPSVPGKGPSAAIILDGLLELCTRVNLQRPRPQRDKVGQSMRKLGQNAKV